MSNYAVITGIRVHGGSRLAELLLAKGYEVAGIVRRSSFNNQLAPRLVRIDR